MFREFRNTINGKMREIGTNSHKNDHCFKVLLCGRLGLMLTSSHLGPLGDSALIVQKL